MNSDFLQRNSIIGDSPAMNALACQIDTAASSNLTVLVSGESGTGKELVARAIHEHSSRSEKPLVCFNCGAITESLLESELFGYLRGAFTGANRDRKGLFEAAEGGTLFLDEIGEMSVSCQVKLLRVLQERTIRPVGGLIESPINVRVIAATNRNLPKEISLGRFRQDLFYRIAVLTIHTPSLRQRPTDIPALVDYFLRETAKTSGGRARRFEEEAIAALSFYSWPGNVRQLRHVVERLSAGTSEDTRITAKAVHQVLNEISRFEAGMEVPIGFRENDSLDDFLARSTLGLYHHFLSLTGNHSEVSRILGVQRNTLYLRIERARRRVQSNGASSSNADKAGCQAP
jgi:transcriptional regulator with PAS, ATPase and Fis domain